ncbi:PREDICTED: carbonic anhydrase 2-like [Polistes canadensis]|uniref:carbonic anhydrase 2-like n=1 Tax=Polistes canadensis TaxID=91411 RepID=UPI000718F233|nr:PREDICTED: carbonic anhydrase 2-like [Polistes canadensis]
MPRRLKHDSRKDVDVPTTISTSSSGQPKWRQSPIDLRTIDTWTQKFPPLLLTGYWLKKGNAIITNTGKTVNIELSNQTIEPYIHGGPLNDDEFKLKNVQFRWGPTDSRGAEHSIDNIWYSMEAQALHWNTRYGSLEKCYDKSDGIAILAYLMQVVGCQGMPDNPAIARVTDHLSKIKKMGSSIEVTPDCLWWMLQGCSEPGYFTYLGSLTVPPFNECVIWIIISHSIKISSHQMNAFRSIYDYKWDPIVNNFRPQQHPCGRRILYGTEFTPYHFRD